MKTEIRSISQPPTITEGKTVEGYAAVFHNPAERGTEYKLCDDIVEHIDPQAFQRAIAQKQPCRCLVNHDPNYRLGRVDKGTLRLTTDERGLKYEADIPDTQVGRDTATDLANGNLDGSSFSFSVVGQRWEDVKRGDDYMTIRTITDVDLYDVGPVGFPAYEATTAGIRSAERMEDVIAQRDAWRAANKESVATRLRVIEIQESLE